MFSPDEAGGKHAVRRGAPSSRCTSGPAAATMAMAVWLEENRIDTGDRVVGGIETCATLASSDGLRIASCHLPTLIDYRDRPAEDVLRTVDKPLQR